MGLIETLTVTVGGAVARTLLKLWLKDEELAQSVGLSLSDLARHGAKSFLEGRSLIRSFERVAEEVARKLAPFIDAEFHDLDPNEVNAAILAAQETIDEAKLDDSALFATDLEPLRLEAALRVGKPNAAAESHLSQAGTAIYDFTVREAANYIAEVVSTLPEFQSRATRELLGRESKLISLVEEVLQRLPEETGFGDPDRFEAQYRREVARKLDRLELFGVRTSELNRRYALSVAYIDLTASTSNLPDEEEAEAGGSEERDRAAQVELSIERVLSRSNRHLIRGEAGSGKTTLLQWLAVSSARRSLGPDLEPAEGLIPFFIQLRRFVGHDLPQPSEFPAAINRSVAEKTPPGWAIEQMERGRALVLIDGVDELREDERDNAAEWLLDLIEAYPDAGYVVTSRPPAVSETWLNEAKLSPAFLEPMDIASIDTFIDHWHDAAETNVEDEEEADELSQLATRLQTTVRENGQIRSLAASPLLCAMLCALNRDWKGRLPRDRVELYRIGLEMLLERRDVVREVPTDDLEISRTQKEVLLQDLAYWLLINGFSDARSEDVDNLLQEKVVSMPHLEGAAEEVLQHLLLRSGLIREPVEGRIDFVHRTFQEYLTAKRIVEDRSVGLLVERSAEDQWQEVVVLAAGLGPEEFGQTLIRALLARAEAEQKHRHRLQLLAVACLETTPVLPKELQDEIKSVLRGLIPPRSMSEAKAIASAGMVAIPLLATHHDDPVATAAPSARALGLIGGPSAMATLERFSRDTRVTVARELIRSWELFPTGEYAQRVLSRSPLERGSLTVNNNAEQFEAIGLLAHLTFLRCFGNPYRQQLPLDWSPVTSHPTIRRLDINWVDNLIELAWPRGRRSPLADLRILGCGLEEISLANLESLEVLQLAGNVSLITLDGLESLSQLREISIGGSPHLPPDIQLPPRLARADLRDLACEDLSPIALCTDLEELDIWEFEALTEIGDLSGKHKLYSLSLAHCPSLSDLAPLEELESLRELTLRECGVDYLPANVFPNDLLDLTLDSCPLTSLRSITHLTRLESLTISDCDEISDFSAVADFPDLQELALDGSPAVRSLDFLADLRSLRKLDLRRCQQLDSLEPLYGLSALEMVDLRGCPDHLDASPLLARGVHVWGGQFGTLPSFLRRRQHSVHPDA